METAQDRPMPREWVQARTEEFLAWTEGGSHEPRYVTNAEFAQALTDHLFGNWETLEMAWRVREGGGLAAVEMLAIEPNAGPGGTV